MFNFDVNDQRSWREIFRFDINLYGSKDSFSSGGGALFTVLGIILLGILVPIILIFVFVVFSFISFANSAPPGLGVPSFGIDIIVLSLIFLSLLVAIFVAGIYFFKKRYNSQLEREIIFYIDPMNTLYKDEVIGGRHRYQSWDLSTLSHFEVNDKSLGSGLGSRSVSLNLSAVRTDGASTLVMKTTLAYRGNFYDFIEVLKNEGFKVHESVDETIPRVARNTTRLISKGVDKIKSEVLEPLRCPSCDSEIALDDKFCLNCGVTLR